MPLLLYFKFSRKLYEETDLHGWDTLQADGYVKENELVQKAIPKLPVT